MPLVIKTSLLIAAIGALFAMLPQQARAGDPYLCRQELQACLAAGYDPDFCRDNYYLCRYGYIPARSAAVSAPVGRLD